MAQKLRIGFVPEHFSTPLHFARKYHNLDAELVAFPSGTGHMVQSLQNKELDVAIGLTEGWVAALGKCAEKGTAAPFKIVGTYVRTPLCWAISTGAGAKTRDIRELGDLRGKRIGVSRIGSGSYVMGFVLADQRGWLETGKAPFEVVVLNDFKRLRDGVNQGEAEFFMWEHFTSKRYYDDGEIRRVGEIYTPWSSWKIVAREPGDPRVGEMMEKIQKGVRHFEEHQDEAVSYISTELDYTEEDAREWLKTVKFADDVKSVDEKVIAKTVDILRKAGVLESTSMEARNMISTVPTS